MLIYNLIIKLLLLLLVQSSYAGDDAASFCFESNVSLKSVKYSIEFILLEKDSVSFRDEEHCLDIVTTETRKNLLEKYLAKNYKLINADKPKEKGECHLELKTITGAVTSVEMLLGAGFSGTLATGRQTLQVQCRPMGSDLFDLVFFFEEKTRATVSTTVSLKKNEVMNLSTVKQILNEKNKTLGNPQTTITNIESAEETNYELKVY